MRIEGIDIWKCQWLDTHERVDVEDPVYHQKHTFHIYEISAGDRSITFAAGEFSNGMWGFYVRPRRDAPSRGWRGWLRRINPLGR